jgi:hypothetical protein
MNVVITEVLYYFVRKYNYSILYNFYDTSFVSYRKGQATVRVQYV